MTGTRISQLLRDDFKLIAPPHSHLDLTNKKQISTHLKDVLPDQILYTAGLTKVDQAEANPKLAYLLNTYQPKFIARLASKLNIPFYYISTDAVFDGTLQKRPYTEKDKTNPVSVYGKSKLAGEKAVLSTSSNNCVLRTIMIYSSSYPHKKDFARLAHESLNRGEKFEGIEDQIINPIFVDDLVGALKALLKKRARGIYHIAATDYSTNYGFVEKIAKIFRFNKDLIRKVTFEQFFMDKSARRTRYTWIDTSKFQKEIGKNILHSINQGITLFKNQLSSIETQPIDI